MDSVTQSYSVLLVSASAKFMDSVLPLLPERSFSPITKAPDVSSARRCLLERSYDLLIINAPLPDEFGTNFALDICQSTQTGVLLLVRARRDRARCAKRCSDAPEADLPRAFFFHAPAALRHARAPSPHGAENCDAGGEDGGDPARQPGEVGTHRAAQNDGKRGAQVH